jgi:hypothetical protein
MRISQRIFDPIKMPCLIQQAPCPTGHGNRLLTGPSITGGNHPHSVQPEIPHPSRRSANIFAHLGTHQNDIWLWM